MPPLLERTVSHNRKRHSREDELMGIRAEWENRTAYLEPQRTYLKVIRQELGEDGIFVEELTQASGLHVSLVAVLPFRLAEALAGYAGLPLGDRGAWLVGMLNAGEQPSADASREGVRQRVERAFPASTSSEP